MGSLSQSNPIIPYILLKVKEVEMFGKLAVFLCLATVVFAKSDLATDVGKCKGDKPFPLEVRVLNCTTPPCSIIKGTTLTFEIDFVNCKYFRI